MAEQQVRVVEEILVLNSKFTGNPAEAEDKG
jgi:hypothetical protein